MKLQPHKMRSMFVGLSLCAIALFLPHSTYAFSVTPSVISAGTDSITVVVDHDRWACFDPSGAFMNQNSIYPSSQSGAFKTTFCGNSSATGQFHIVSMSYHGSTASGCWGGGTSGGSNYTDCLASGDYDGNADQCIDAYTGAACGGGGGGGGGGAATSTIFSATTTQVQSGDIEYELAWILFYMTVFFVGFLWNTVYSIIRPYGRN